MYYKIMKRVLQKMKPVFIKTNVKRVLVFRRRLYHRTE